MCDEPTTKAPLTKGLDCQKQVQAGPEDLAVLWGGRGLTKPAQRGTEKARTYSFAHLTCSRETRAVEMWPQAGMLYTSTPQPCQGRQPCQEPFSAVLKGHTPLCGTVRSSATSPASAHKLTRLQQKLHYKAVATLHTRSQTGTTAMQ